MAIALLSSAIKQGTSSGTGDTTAINTTGASLLVASVTDYAGATETTLSDSRSNTWILVSAQEAGSLRNRLFYCASPSTSASHTFAATGSTTYPSIQVSAYSGTAASPYDKKVGNGTTTTTTLALGSVTPTENNSLIVAGLSWRTGTLTINVGTVLASLEVISGVSYGSAMAYAIQTTATAVNPTWSYPSGVNAASTAAVFKAAASTNHSLTAVNITSGTPAVGTPAITQKHSLAATAITAATPTVGTPAITQTHSLAATAITAATPTVGSPLFTQNHVLSAASVTAGLPTVGTPALTEITPSGLVALPITAGTPIVGAPAITQKHVLQAVGVTAATPTVGTPILTHILPGVLTALPVTAGIPTVGSPAITQKHVLGAGAVAAGVPTFGPVTLTQQHQLMASNVSAGLPTVGSPALSEGVEIPVSYIFDALYRLYSLPRIFRLSLNNSLNGVTQMCRTLPTMDVEEIKKIIFDFSAGAEVVMLPDISITPISGDPVADTSAMRIGSPLIANAQVMQLVAGGGQAARYRIRCLAQDVDGETHVIAGELVVSVT